MSLFGLAAALAAVRTPLQLALLAYVGAAGMAGVAVVGVVMFTPAGQVVQQAIEPARELVQSILPSELPVFSAFDARQDVAVGPVVIVSHELEVVADASPLPVVDETSEPVVEEPALVESAVLGGPDARRQVSLGSQPATLAHAGDVTTLAPEAAPGYSAPVAVQPAQVFAVPAGVLPEPTLAAVNVPESAQAIPIAGAQATPRPRPVELPTAAPVAQATATGVPVRPAASRARSEAVSVAPQPTPVPPTPVLPTVVPPTPVPAMPVPTVPPTVAPTQVPAPTGTPVVSATRIPAPTATPAPSQTPVPPTPTSRPTQTGVPTHVATGTPVPAATPKPTIKPTSVPTHAPATSTPVKRVPTVTPVPESDGD